MLAFLTHSFVAIIFAPASRRSFTTSVWPSFVAYIKAVWFLWAFKYMQVIHIKITWAKTWKVRFYHWPLALTALWDLNKASQALKWPLCAAKINAVLFLSDNYCGFNSYDTNKHQKSKQYYFLHEWCHIENEINCETCCLFDELIGDLQWYGPWSRRSFLIMQRLLYLAYVSNVSKQLPA